MHAACRCRLNMVLLQALGKGFLTTEVTIRTIDSAAVCADCCLLTAAGAMGPISVADMAAWLLQGTAPRQLSRPCHKPLLDMVAADRSQLLVCGVVAAELQQVLMSGEDCAGLLARLGSVPCMRADVSCLVDSARHP